MNEFAAAVGGTAAFLGAGAFMIARSWPVPSGRHRASRHPVSAPVALLRPVEALDQFEAHCPVQDRDTLHLRLATGGTCCTECRHTTPTATGGEQ